MDTTTNDNRLTEALDREFKRNRDNIARQVLALADQLSRIEPSRSSDLPYAQAASEVVHVLANALPNLNLGGLIKAAADADTQSARDQLATELTKGA